MNFGKFKRKEEDNVENYQNRIVYDITKNISLAKPAVTWDDICGMDKEKYFLQQNVLMPIILSECKMEVSMNSIDVLIYGPSGVGKTLLVQALAAQLKSTLFLIEGKEFIDTYKTKSEVVIKRIFSAAKQCYRAIVLINDLDSFYSGITREWEMRSRVLSEIVKQLSSDSRRLNFLIIATTNHPERLVFTILTRAAFSKVYIPLPDLPTRQALVNKYLKEHPHKLTHADIQGLATRMNGLTSQDIISMVRYACYEPVREAQKAKFFKTVQRRNSSGKLQYEVVDNGSEEERREYLDILVEGEVKFRDVKMEDFEKAFREIERFEDVEQIEGCERFRALNEL